MYSGVRAIDSPPKNRRFSHKNSKMFDFRFNTPTPFPESGSRKRFHGPGMRGIDFSHKITPRKVFFLNWRKKFSASIFSPPPPSLSGGNQGNLLLNFLYREFYFT